MIDIREKNSRQSPQKNEAIQVIDFNEVFFETPHPDVHVAKILISNASWVNTTEGTVVIDTLLSPNLGKKMKKRIDKTGGPVTGHVEARRLRLKILEKLCEADYCLMSRNTWVYFMDQDKAFLGFKE